MAARAHLTTTILRTTMEQTDVVLAASPDHHTATSFGLPSPERCQSPGASPGTDVIAQYEARLTAKHHELLQLKRRLQVGDAHHHHVDTRTSRCSTAAPVRQGRPTSRLCTLLSPKCSAWSSLLQPTRHAHEPSHTTTTRRQASSKETDAKVKQLQQELAQRAALHQADVRDLERQLQQAQLHASRGGGAGLAEHLRQRLALEGALQAAQDAAAEAQQEHKVRMLW